MMRGRMMLAGLLLIMTALARGERVLVWSDGRVEPASATGKIVPGHPTKTVGRKGTTTTWNITYLDVTNNTNIGFADATLGAARRQVLERVLARVGGYLSTAYAASVEVQVSATSGDWFSWGGAYYDSVNGFMDADSQKTLIWGQDAYPTYADLLLQVNFGQAYYLGTGQVPADQHDLESKLLGSVFHAMGILAMTDASGNSTDINGYRLRTRWESFLTNAAGQHLFDANGYFMGTSAWLTGGAGTIQFRGAWAQSALGRLLPVYTPSTFRSDQSLVSWAQDATLAGSVLSLEGNTAIGTMNRYPKPWDLGALKDLGYPLAVTVRKNAVRDWTQWGE